MPESDLQFVKKIHDQDQEILHTKLCKFLLLWRKSLSNLTKYKIKNALFLEKFTPAKLWSQQFHLWVNYIYIKSY